MKKMLKRADGSYSQRGLWDNIRANKGSGKEPTKEMLKQEKKIKASSKKTGGKSMYNFLEESKELMFGGPSKKYQTAGPTMSTKDAVGQVFQGKMTAAQGQAAIGYKPKPAMTPGQKAEFMSKLKTSGKKYQTGGPNPPRFTGTGTIQMPMPKPATKKKDNEKTKKSKPTSVYSNPRDLPSVRMDKSGKPVKKRMGGKNC
jgi:hypothetical protein